MIRGHHQIRTWTRHPWHLLLGAVSGLVGSTPRTFPWCPVCHGDEVLRVDPHHFERRNRPSWRTCALPQQVSTRWFLWVAWLRVWFSEKFLGECLDYTGAGLLGRLRSASLVQYSHMAANNNKVQQHGVVTKLMLKLPAPCRTVARPCRVCAVPFWGRGVQRIFLFGMGGHGLRRSARGVLCLCLLPACGSLRCGISRRHFSTADAHPQATLHYLLPGTVQIFHDRGWK